MERRGFVRFGVAGVAMALAPKAWALKLFPKPSTQKWAVLYATWCGSSRDAGIWISEGMGGIAEVFDIREQPDLKGFDHIVLGSSIRAGKIHPLMDRYLSDNKAWLKDRIRGMWALCNNMGNPPGPEQKKAYIDEQLATLCSVRNVPGTVFAGRITKDLMEPGAAAMMKSFPDSDRLKRADCLAFGKEILAAMR
jgi:menaquinone-dependent protoporphyrinogen IX oxidase